MINSLKPEILSYLQKCYPKEGCGIVLLKKGKLHWVPITNIASDQDDFVLDPQEYFLERQKGDVIGIVHSHVNAPSVPSLNDIIHSEACSIPYYIFSLPSGEASIHTPSGWKNLLGRNYIFGYRDCFEAMRDYYISVGLEIPTRDTKWQDDWWEYNEDYFSDENLNAWNFRRVLSLQTNDLLIFNVGGDCNNHCGVYIGQDLFFHHAVNRLSCRDNLYPFWKKFLTGIYRYET